MGKKRNQYQFKTHWKVIASEEEVYHILDDVNEIKRWWPSVYLDVRTLEEGS